MTQATVRERKSHIWAKHPDDWYVEEPWCAKRLFQTVGFAGHVHDPCCGRGTIVDAAVNWGYTVTCADIVDRNAMSTTWGPDFKLTRYQDDQRVHDTIITNPPFGAINGAPSPFLEWALAHVKHSVAVLVPFKWFGGDKRARYLSTLPLTAVYVLTPRPSMPPGNVLEEMEAWGERPQGGKEDFAWAIFNPSGRKVNARPIMRWLHRDA